MKSIASTGSGKRSYVAAKSHGGRANEAETHALDVRAEAGTAEQFQLLHPPLEVAVARRGVPAEDRFVLLAGVAGELDQVAFGRAQPLLEKVWPVHTGRVGDAEQPIVARVAVRLLAGRLAAAERGQKQPLRPGAGDL